MMKRLLELLVCPECRSELELAEFRSSDGEIVTGLLSCSKDHFYPIAGGIPRMLPSSINEYWHSIQVDLPSPVPPSAARLIASEAFDGNKTRYDARTKANFSAEWEHHNLGDKTWGMELSDRVQWFFLDSIGIPEAELKGKLMLDAGCGNGSQSVAYTAKGLEVVAIDLSTGLEKGYEFRKQLETAKPDMVHFVQGDLQKPPFPNEIFDIIHTAGVLQATPNTKQTFMAIRPLLRRGGTFYTWVIGYERFVTPLVNSIRAITTRMSTASFSAVAQVMAYPFVSFCWALNKLGIRQYNKITRREAILGLHDIFGAPYAYYHSYPELAGWYEEAGFDEMWPCNASRRGVGICGVLPKEN